MAGKGLLAARNRPPPPRPPALLPATCPGLGVKQDPPGTAGHLVSAVLSPWLEHAKGLRGQGIPGSRAPARGYLVSQAPSARGPRLPDLWLVQNLSLSRNVCDLCDCVKRLHLSVWDTMMCFSVTDTVPTLSMFSGCIVSGSLFETEGGRERGHAVWFSGSLPRWLWVGMENSLGSPRGRQEAWYLSRHCCSQGGTCRKPELDASPALPAPHHGTQVPYPPC